MVGNENVKATDACPRALHTLQLSLLLFFALAIASVAVIYAVAPAIYTASLDGSARASDTHPVATTGLLVAVVLVVALLTVGILRHWRWVFWLVLVAFTLSVLQIPGGILELRGNVPPSFPAWYVLFRMLVGAVQFAIGISMIRLYRRCGVWAEGRQRPSR